MKEPYIEDLASHNGRESCSDSHKGIVETLTVVRTDPVIEFRNIFLRTIRRKSKGTIQKNKGMHFSQGRL